MAANHSTVAVIARAFLRLIRQLSVVVDSYDVARKSHVHGDDLLLDFIRILVVLTDASAGLCQLIRKVT